MRLMLTYEADGGPTKLRPIAISLDHVIAAWPDEDDSRVQVEYRRGWTCLMLSNGRTQEIKMPFLDFFKLWEAGK